MVRLKGSKGHVVKDTEAETLNGREDTSKSQANNHNKILEYPVPKIFKRLFVNQIKIIIEKKQIRNSLFCPSINSPHSRPRQMNSLTLHSALISSRIAASNNLPHTPSLQIPKHSWELRAPSYFSLCRPSQQMNSLPSINPLSLTLSTYQDKLTHCTITISLPTPNILCTITIFITTP